MTTQERIERALPKAEEFVQRKLRIAELVNNPIKPPTAVFRSADEGHVFDQRWAEYIIKKKEWEIELADQNVLISYMNRWGEDDNLSLSELLSGSDGEYPIQLIVKVEDIEYRVHDDSDGIVYCAL